MSKFNFNIDISNDQNDQNEKKLEKSIYTSKSQKQLIDERSQYVDLSLKSGNLWAKYNLGSNASKGILNEPNDLLGPYYAWGELKSKSLYGWDHYIFVPYGFNTNFTKYSKKDHKLKLELEDDIANIELGGKWVIPRYKDFEELVTETNNSFVSKYEITEGVYKSGYLFKSNKRNNHSELFIPVCGLINGRGELCANYDGWYWSSEIYGENFEYAYKLLFNDRDICVTSHLRCDGLQIRPVLKRNI